jgi:mannitol/fructose-specific phosphotransferase system IIA component (Ntr-type)
MLAAKDKISHLEALGDLIKSMNDDDFIKKLLNSKNKNDVYNYIMRHKNDLL